MKFEDYEDAILPLAIYPNVGNNIVYPTLGLSGESGEIAEKVKKVIRDSNGELTEETRESLVKELGDVLWYLTALANELDSSLGEVALKNIDKLTSRSSRGKLHGSGDDR